jgi:hypothetical protein
VVAVSQVLTTGRATKSVLLVAMMLAPGLLLLTPVEAQTACTAAIESMASSPMFLDAGETTTVSARVVNGQGTGGQAQVRISVEFASGTNPSPVTRSVTIPGTVTSTISTAGAGAGRASVTFELLGVGNPTTPGFDPTAYCPPATADNPYEWGFWVDQKPDLSVTDFDFVQHLANEDATTLPNSGGPHAAEFAPGLRYTRYPTVTSSAAQPNGCLEQTSLAPGHLHLRLTVHNGGEADFDALGTAGEGALPVRVRVFEGAQLIGNGLANVSVAHGQDSPDVVLAFLDYSLLNKTGPRPLQVVIDSDNVYAETDDSNNVFPANPTDEPNLVVRAPDLTSEWTAEPQVSADRKVSGTVRMVNVDADEGEYAGAVGNAPPNTEHATICHSKNAAPLWLKVYDNVLDDQHVIGNMSGSLDSGETMELSFAMDHGLRAGGHTIFAVADASPDGVRSDNANERDEANNIASRGCPDVTSLCIPDLLAPVIVQRAPDAPDGQRVGARINITGTIRDDADFAASNANYVFVNITYPNMTAFSFIAANLGDRHIGVNNSDEDPLCGTCNYTFWYNASYPLEGTYSVVINAVDAAHSVFSGTQQFTLSDFPKTVTNVTVQVCDGTAVLAPVPSNPPTNGQTGDVGCTENNHTFVPTEVTAVGETASNITGNWFHLKFRVPQGATGILNEFSNPARKSVQVADPEGNVLGNFTVQALCWNNATGSAGGATAIDCQDAQPNPTGGEPIGGSAFPCGAATNNCYNYTFDLVLGLNFTSDGVGGNGELGCAGTGAPRTLRLLRPGEYNLTLWVGDAGCNFKANGRPNLPLQTFQLWAPPSTNITATSIVNHANNAANALETLRFRTNVTSAMEAGAVPAISRVALEVYWPNATSLGTFNMTPASDVERASGNGTYTLDLATGLGGPLDVAGTYRYLVAVKDANQTWSFSNDSNPACAPSAQSCTPRMLSFTILDTRPPTVTDAQVGLSDGTPATVFEGGANITLQANVDDDTRLTAQGIIQSGSTGGELLRVNLTRVAGTLWRSEAIPTGNNTTLPEGLYRYVLHVVDAANPPNVIDTVPAEFSIAGNLPPTFTGLIPAANGFLRKSGTVSFDVNDEGQGVNADSIVVKVGTGGTATQTLTNVLRSPATGVARSVRVSFPLGAEFDHGANVTVLATAVDASATPASLQWNFTVDGAPPISTISCTQSLPANCAGVSTAVVRGDTGITVRASDADPRVVSGVQAIRYTIEAGGQQVAQEAKDNTTTFSLAGRNDGVYRLRWHATDLAGNEEGDHTVDLVLDTAGPQVALATRVQTSAGANISATITDLSSDVSGATVFYRTDVTGYTELPMSRLNETRSWFGEVPGARRGVRLCYYIEATDRLGNVGGNATAASPECFTAENHPPQLTVLEPGEGEAAGASMDVRWQTGDIDNDPVTVALSLRRAGDVQLRSITLTSEDQGRRSRTVDTTDLVPGTYQLRVDAFDNQPFANRTTRTVNVTIGGPGGNAREPSFDRAVIAAGDTVTVRVEIPDPVADIEARLVKDGRTVDRKEMDQNPAGSRFYEATFRVAEPGTYKVVIVGQYEDGTPFEIQGAATLTVRGGLGIAADAVVIGVLAAVVVAMAALGLRRRGWK